MATQTEYQRRYDYRRQKVNEFYHELDRLYYSLQNVPDDDQREQDQIRYLEQQLRRIENEMDVFIKDLYD
jgi:cysteinyl-tRNA synthetase